MAPQEFAPLVFSVLTRGLASRRTSPHWEESVGLHCGDQYFMFPREKPECVRNDDCVPGHALGPSSLRFLWFLLPWGSAARSDDGWPCGQGRSVSGLWGRESGYTGGEGVGFL